MVGPSLPALCPDGLQSLGVGQILQVGLRAFTCEDQRPVEAGSQGPQLLGQKAQFSFLI